MLIGSTIHRDAAVEEFFLSMLVGRIQQYNKTRSNALDTRS